MYWSIHLKYIIHNPQTLLSLKTKMYSLQKYRFCFLAGLCAAGGSFFGKMPSFLKEDTNFYTKEMPLLATSLQSYGGKLRNL